MCVCLWCVDGPENAERCVFVGVCVVCVLGQWVKLQVCVWPVVVVHISHALALKSHFCSYNVDVAGKPSKLCPRSAGEFARTCSYACTHLTVTFPQISSRGASIHTYMHTHTYTHIHTYTPQEATIDDAIPTQDGAGGTSYDSDASGSSSDRRPSKKARKPSTLARPPVGPRTALASSARAAAAPPGRVRVVGVRGCVVIGVCACSRVVCELGLYYWCVCVCKGDTYTVFGDGLSREGVP